MPNYCSNNFTATGKITKKVRSALINADWQFSFNCIDPLPKKLEWTTSPAHIVPDSTDKYAYILDRYTYLSDPEWVKKHTPAERNKEIRHQVRWILTESESQALIKAYWHNNWYDWQCANRWTKRDCCDPNIAKDASDEISVSFDTARSPPSEWFEKLCKKFPQITFELEYEEPGMAFEGTLQSDGEGWFRDDCREYVPTCSMCEEKKDTAEWRENIWLDICDDCLADWAFTKCESCGEWFDEDDDNIKVPSQGPSKCSWCND